ncbi:hypothetical protein PG997_008259 [Apiospora hydei]|uniref:Uncharacterized protein n=1 Tax=Apiospora hydei TaxID=1337664 RepID=A0ABR1WAB6_9PEZI
MLDLSILKYQYARQWHSIKCLRAVCIRRKEESDDDFRKRTQDITQHCARGDKMNAAKWELFDHATIAPDSSIWGALDPAGVEITAYANAYRVEKDAGMQKIVAEIVFAILRHLHGLSTPQSVGAANSIWQSLRVDVVDAPRGSGRRDLPDTVSDELFSHPDVIQCPFNVLQLDKTLEGSYHQAWLIDRIMDQGFLWTARYRPDTNAWPESSRSKSRIELKAEHEPSLEKKAKTIIERQLRRRLGATMMVVTSHEHPSESTQTQINTGSTAWFAEFYSWDFMSREADRTREKELVAVFDFDGPCTVATPFNPDWEVLPRPSLRGMSVCWVMEPLEKLDSNDGEAQAARVEGVSVSASGKGKEPEQSSSTAGARESETCGSESETWTEDGNTLFQVVNKVKGMWQIMDPPHQLYSFV